MRYIITCTVFLYLNLCLSQSAQSLYKQKCFTCHNSLEASEGLTGPFLGGITNEVSVDWFLEYTRNSLKLMRDHDYRALCTWENWKPCVMPDFKKTLTDRQIIDIYNYIAEVTAEKNLVYPYGCDSNRVSSDISYHNFEKAICSKFDLKIGHSNWDLRNRKSFKVTIRGEYNKIRFYLAYTKRKELIEISPSETDEYFDFNFIEMEPGINYLIIVCQDINQELDIEKIALSGSLPEVFQVVLTEKGSLLSELNAIQLND